MAQIPGSPSQNPLESMVAHIGHSLETPGLREWTEAIGCPIPGGEGTFQTKFDKIKLSFISEENFRQRYRQSPQVRHPGRGELILHTLTLSTLSAWEGDYKAPALPFELAPGWHAEGLESRLKGKRYYSNRVLLRNQEVVLSVKYDMGTVNAQILTNTRFGLEDIIFTPFRLEERQRLDFIKSIKGQKDNIERSNRSAVMAQLEDFPSQNWTDPDQKKPKAKLDKALSTFVEKIAQNTTSRNGSNIYKETGKLVKSINRISGAHPGFIETMEREILAKFITETVKLSGFVVPDEIDITEEWREW